MITKYFTLDGKNSASFNVGLSGSGTYRSSERDIKTTHVEGRNGDLLMDNDAFLNRIITYPCWIAHTFKSDFDRADNLSTIFLSPILFVILLKISLIVILHTVTFKIIFE